MSEWNVTGTTNVNAAYTASYDTKSDAAAKQADAKNTDTAGVVYEKGDTPKKATYSINKMSAEERAALVQKLKQDAENRKSQLSNLVSQMLGKQGNVSNLSKLFSPENLKNVSMEDILQAKKDVAEDGYWGVKQTSQRLFDFASALAGDDVDKMKEMQAAMKKGFEKATKAWGGELPSICKDTIDAADKLFEAYYESKSAVNE